MYFNIHIYSQTCLERPANGESLNTCGLLIQVKFTTMEIENYSLFVLFNTGNLSSRCDCVYIPYLMNIYQRLVQGLLDKQLLGQDLKNYIYVCFFV